jgi:hypothetical protein
MQNRGFIDYMIFDYQNKTILIKVVYYGPAMSGKTTTLKFLFSYFNKEKELESIENTMGRTLFFDFGVLQFSGSEWNLKFLLYSATGQDFYAVTRPSTLTGVDGIIFVADSQNDYLEYNLRSWNELKTLFGLELYEVPIIIAFNKYDLNQMENLDEKNFIEKIDIKKFKSINIEKTVALTGKGVINSFKNLIAFIFPQITMIIN